MPDPGKPAQEDIQDDASSPSSSGKKIEEIDYLLDSMISRMTGTYEDADYSDKYIKQRLNSPNLLTAETIAKNPSQYMIVLNFWYFNTLVDLNPKQSLYIHSLSEPFNEEMELSHDRMMNWLTYFNVQYVQAHCSGHICGTDLKAQIERIHPKLLFPIHTEYPGMFRRLSPKTKI